MDALIDSRLFTTPSPPIHPFMVAHHHPIHLSVCLSCCLLPPGVDPTRGPGRLQQHAGADGGSW